MTDNIKVSPTNEIISAIFSNNASDAELTSFVSDPKLAISELAGIDVGSDVAMTVAQNAGNDIHLVLPYYDAVEDIQDRLASLSASELEQISGGEIFISLIILGGIAAGAVTGIGCGVGAAIAGVAAGAVTGAVVIGGTAGGIIEREKQGK